MRISACALLVTATSTILGACGSDIVAAPSPRYLPLAPSAVVAATLVTTSDIDSSDPRRFRRMDLASDHQSGATLLRTETCFLLQHGWKHLQITTCCKSKPSGTGVLETSTPTSITNPKATVQLDSPDGSNYVSMDVIAVDPKHFYINDPRSTNRSLKTRFRHDDGLVDVTVAAPSP
jgi:hypothetical protein